MTTKCFRCGGIVPKPDLKEAIARESDWRVWLNEHPEEEPEEGKVLICIKCANELEDIDE